MYIVSNDFWLLPKIKTNFKCNKKPHQRLFPSILYFFTYHDAKIKKYIYNKAAKNSNK